MSDGRAMPGRAIPRPTGTRGVAASWGVFYHPHEATRFDPCFAPPSQVPPVREVSRGVDPFFVPSGFVPMPVHRDRSGAARGTG